MISLIDINSHIRKRIQSYLYRDVKTIVVLKGVNIGIYDEDFVIDIGKILENKFGYFSEIVQSGRKVITYDEYMLLYDFVLAQYNKIVILENNLFINYYPLEVKMSDDMKKSLLVHYDEEKMLDNEINDVTDLTSVYANFKCINGRYYVVYNNIVSHEKEFKIQMFENISENIEREIVEPSSLCYKIIDEEDYISMIDDVMNNMPDKIYILEKNTALSKVLIEKIKILKYIFKDSIEIKIGIVKEDRSETNIRKEFLDILKTYWGYDSFRKIKVYDISRLNNKEKAIEEVSQGEIIAKIVEQVEKCYHQENYRDVFVTAPTGAGKSVMFQIPAIYLTNEYELFTIVISPLIGLMKDQVNNLENLNYSYARTINSDISPIQRQKIINDIADKKCHILYISPESLLSKSDLEQIIGDRTLGLLVVDEAHIVTTWGKQFRPDYWYLGDHLNKIKKAQIKKKGMGFVIATFTATAIYGGIENMYEETVQSLKMVDPITYLGFVKRDDIKINVKRVETITGRTEYELNKFDQLFDKIDYALMFNKKMLIYFPTIALIERFWDYCTMKNIIKYISKYHGNLSAYEKEENYQKFKNSETLIMLATKAFGMGIDINDIEIVAHFAPTGNVCDYIQEIGRAARRPDLNGEAYYRFMKNDFKHINRLHGLSIVKEYQLIEVIRKVHELYQENIKNEGKFTKRRNGMLVDAESFSHIFETPFFNEDDGINKVKTAMLLIQKDFERRFGFSPFYTRPIPIFEIGYFKIDPVTQKNIVSEYGEIVEELDHSLHICSVNLKKIWEQDFNVKYSFPKFKYLLYTKDNELMFGYKEDMKPALSVNIKFQNNYLQRYDECMNAIKTIINKSIREEKFYDIDGKDGLVKELMSLIYVNEYKARSIIETIISAMSVYQRDYNRNIHGKVLAVKPLKSGDYKYKFMNGSSGFFRWIENGFNNICDNTKDGTLYLIDEEGDIDFKEKILILGVLETFGVLVFKALGGRNSQIYIYVNQTKTMREIINKPWSYKNKLLELISERHKMSVEMLTYLFQGGFSNEEFWSLIEDYFLGIIPDKVIKAYEKSTGKKVNY